MPNVAVEAFEGEGKVEVAALDEFLASSDFFPVLGLSPAGEMSTFSVFFFLASETTSDLLAVTVSEAE